MNPPDANSVVRPLDMRWLSGVRIAAVLAPLWACGGLLLADGAVGGWRDFMFELVPILLPYAHILWGLRRGPQKSALALAVATGTGALGIVVAPSIPRVILDGGFSRTDVGIGLIALMQAVLAVSAVKAYYGMAPEATDTRTLKRGFKQFAGYFAIFVVGTFVVEMDYHSRAERRGNEASITSALRTINAAESTYREVYRAGFSPTLEALGPPAKGAQASASAADFIDPVTASGRKNGYSCTYRPGFQNAAGHVTTYTVSARPITYGTTGTRSFFTDESGVIRWTSGDRAATAKDPPIAQ